jgi:hypothetical protein
MKSRLAIFFSAISFSAIASAADPPESTATPKLNAMVVYGADFAFSVSEPDGWIGDTENAAQWNCNVFFYPKGQDPKDATLIRVTVASKVSDDTNNDLKADMDRYSQHYPKVLFKNLEASHPAYRSFPKLFLVPGEFSEYVTYLNPGPKSRHLLSVSMSKQRSEANPQELATYRTALRSVLLLSE